MTNRRVSARIALLAISSIASIGFAELVFRAYESSFLVRELPRGARSYPLDALRYNDHEGTLEEGRRPGEYRILSFGDSFAYSVTTAQYAYAAQLQERLSRTAGRRVRVVNLGRTSTSFSDYLAQLHFWTDQVEYDAILMNVYAGNDFDEETSMALVAGTDPRATANDASGTTYGPGVEIPHRFALRLIDYAYALYLGLTAADGGIADDERYQPGANHYRRDGYVRAQARALRTLRAEQISEQSSAHLFLYKLLRALRTLEQNGTAVALTVAPPHFAVDSALEAEVLERSGLSRSALDFDLPGVLVRELAAATGLEGPVLDLGSCLREAAGLGEEVYWGTNSHWSVRGNELVADRLAASLAEHWPLGREVGAAPDLPACSTHSPEATPELRRYVDDAVPVFDSIIALEQSVLADLTRRAFEDRASLEETLAARGYTEAAGRIEGAFWGFLPKPKSTFSRPHGLSSAANLQGWARNLDSTGEPVMVALFRNGRLQGVGRTSMTLGDRQRSLPGIADDVPNLVFEVLIRRPSREIQSLDEIWVVALSGNDRYAHLPYAAGVPELRVPGQ